MVVLGLTCYVTMTIALHHAHFFINLPLSGQAIGFLCLLRAFFTANLQMATPTSLKSDSQFSS
ncbi:hypothetical protein BpHYR1_053416 [Brachionus plicatilis]|uniref:Uncharacterized protein n=1 Tax=Brachionus plicatilis TaxID=10195 RepID=A0A3M7S047_BRAPC|nr:hypothetical protein BpHYR1_053416 [Brachionus plicatilis]